ncbi:hypothetical protein [Agrobacterium sp. CG674]
MGTYVGEAGASLHDKLGRGCGTVACIAGHAFMCANPFGIRPSAETDADEIETAAAEFLGLDTDTARHLFYDLPEHCLLEDVSAEAAIDTLQRLAQTGIVHWNL